MADDTKTLINKFYVEFKTIEKLNSSFNNEKYINNKTLKVNFNKKDSLKLYEKVYNLLKKENLEEFTIINGIIYKKLSLSNKSIQEKSDISRFKYSYLIDGYLNESNVFLSRLGNYNYTYIFDLKNDWNIENMKTFEYKVDSFNYVNIKNIDIYNSYLKVLSKEKEHIEKEDVSLDLLKRIITLKIIKSLYKKYNNKKVLEINSTLGYSCFLLTKITNAYNLESKIQRLSENLDSKNITMLETVYRNYSEIFNV